MFDPIVYLLYAVTGFAVFFGTVPLAVALIRRDQQRIDRMLDVYIEVFKASAEAIISAMRMFRRKNLPSPDYTSPPEAPTLSPSETKQISKQ